MAQETKSAQIVILSGPSGSGKTTIVERVMSNSPVKMIKAVSATTRPKREKEVEGESYYFLSPQEFLERQTNDEFIETAEVFGAGYWYGTLRSEIERAAQNNAWVFLEIDVKGALKVMEQYPDTLSFFLKTPSESEYEQRLRSRGTEAEDVIQRRLATARKELQSADKYRYQIVNDNLDRAVQEISNILVEWGKQIHAGRVS